MQDLSNALEQALKYRVEQGEFPINIYTGQGDFNKEHPSLVIHAQGGEEMPLDSGNWHMDVSFELRQSASGDGLPAFRQLCSDVFGLLMANDLAALLSEESENFHALGVYQRQTREFTEDTHWISVLTFRCYCCQTDLT